mmetsp:Transcript_40291/g.95469  ORF Transcript_40291/g.95469 Transcript_40291/m.95469 type:complete len:798 (+) Transcript_40291:82-2475(+)
MWPLSDVGVGLDALGDELLPTGRELHRLLVEHLQLVEHLELELLEELQVHVLRHLRRRSLALDFGARGHGPVARAEEPLQLARLLLVADQHHPVALHPLELRGLEVEEDHNALPDQLCHLVLPTEACAHLLLPRITDVHLDDKEGVLFGVLCDFEDLGHAHVAREHLRHHHHLLLEFLEKHLPDGHGGPGREVVERGGKLRDGSHRRAQLLEHLGGRARDVGGEEVRQDVHGLQHAPARDLAAEIRVLLGDPRSRIGLDVPGCEDREVLVGVLDCRQCCEHRLLELEGAHGLVGLGREADEVEGGGGGHVRDEAAAVLLCDVRRPVHEVAEGVGELGVVHQDQPLLRVRDVSAEGRGVGEVKAERVRPAHPVELIVGVDDVSEGLGHLLALPVVDEPVGEDGGREGEVARHEHARPDHAVEPDDVLADEVDASRPEVGVGPIRVVAPREVVGQRVKPHVHDVGLPREERGVLRDRHAPVEGSARDGEVAERLAQPLQHFVAPHCRLDELRVRLDVGEKALLVLGHLEEVGLLGHLVERLPRRGVLVVRQRRIVLGDKRLLADIVPPGVGVEVDVAVLGGLDEQLLRHDLVLVHGGADVEVVSDINPLVQLLEGQRVLVADVDRAEAHALGGLRDLLPVLVRAGQEEHLAAVDAVVARDDVCGDRLVRVPHVRDAVGVVDRRRDVELLAGGVHGGEGGEERARRACLGPNQRVLAHRQVIHEGEPREDRGVVRALVRGQDAPGGQRGVEAGPEGDVCEGERGEHGRPALRGHRLLEAGEEGEGVAAGLRRGRDARGDL